MSFVLLLVLATHDAKPVGMSQLHFHDKSSCEKAAMQIQETIGADYHVTVMCLAQGLRPD
jgi:hypothetical protein